MDVPAAELVERFDAPGVRAIALLGSAARGTAARFSDVDLVRLVERHDAASGDATATHLIRGRLVVVSDVDPSGIERWFNEPQVAVDVVAGLRDARALLDRGGAVGEIRARAEGFVWDAQMQRRADRWASRQMVGWAEEACKGLQGLIDDHVGRLLNARHGLSWGLVRVVRVQRGIMIRSDNDVLDSVAANVGADSRWMRLCRRAFGVEPAGSHWPSLREQIVAGLELYVETSELVAPALGPGERLLVAEVTRQITEALAATRPGGACPPT